MTDEELEDDPVPDLEVPGDDDEDEDQTDIAAPPEVADGGS